MAVDLSAFEDNSGADLSKIINLADQVVGIEETISGLEEALKAHKSELHILRTKTLPDALSEVGMSDFTTEAGVKIKIDDFVSGGLPREGEKRDIAIRELEKIGGADLMRDDLSVTFDKSQHNEALSLRASLEEQGLAVKFGSNIHASTLHAFIREKLRAGEAVDYEKIGLYVGRIAKITIPKKK